MNQDVKKHNRETYSFLDWVGDCGGLFDGLINFGNLLINPLAVYTLQTKLASLIVNFRSSEKQDDQNDTDGDDGGEGKDNFDHKASSTKSKDRSVRPL